MPQHYRVIVIGCGAIGAATAYWLSRRPPGDAVLALEPARVVWPSGAREQQGII